MNPQVKVAFASGSDELNQKLVARMLALYPELPLFVVSEFAPMAGTWIPYHPRRSLRENLAKCRAALGGAHIRLAGVLLVPQVPLRRMRLMALLLAPRGLLAFNENLDSWMLRPRSIPAIARHLGWRVRNFVRWQWNRDWRAWWPFALAAAGGWLAALQKAATRPAPAPGTMPQGEEGISVVIPSRNGAELLARLLPGLLRELEGFASEVIVVDNGSDESWEHPGVIVERSAAPLSFARAVNRGIRRARYRRVCLLNNDMVLEPGFFSPLRDAFRRVPELFCATAQIFFPPGVRREETGKANYGHDAPTDFPVRCDLPIPGEDLSYVLYGSGGCSLYDAAKLRALGGADEAYEPAYVEDLDLGYRAWRRGWPTVFVAAARVEHRHRATTSRYFTQAELDLVLEINCLRFLARAVASPPVFRGMWRQAIERLRLLGNRRALAFARRAPLLVETSAGDEAEELILALGSGRVAVFPGRAHGGRAVVIATPYLPYPLAHGGAVRMYHLMRHAARTRDLVLVAFTERLQTPPPELLELCAEIVLVERAGSHMTEAVEEFASPAFRAALRQTMRKWRPAIAQLEYTQMGHYAADCGPAKTILVEHDIAFDFYRQLLEWGADWEARRQFEQWRDFETRTWTKVDRVVTMSAKDAALVRGAPAVVLPNGVDLDYFRPSAGEPDPARLLLVAPFAHAPNRMAVEFFLSEVWPRLQEAAPVLHLLRGARPERFAVAADLAQPGIEVEDFVPDLRPAYVRATVVIAPLVVSAGTKIKILEAMAMGKAIVGTAAGIAGLEVSPGEDLLVAADPEAMAAAILGLLRNAPRRRALETSARRTAERLYGWETIARRQERLYRDLEPVTAPAAGPLRRP